MTKILKGPIIHNFFGSKLGFFQICFINFGVYSKKKDERVDRTVKSRIYKRPTWILDRKWKKKKLVLIWISIWSASNGNPRGKPLLADNKDNKVS